MTGDELQPDDRVLTIPVLIGGPGHGTPVTDQSLHVIKCAVGRLTDDAITDERMVLYELEVFRVRDRAMRIWRCKDPGFVDPISAAWMAVEWLIDHTIKEVKRGNAL